MGLREHNEGSERLPESGNGEGIFLPQSAFSKWNMRKLPIFLAWKSPVLSRNSAILVENGLRVQQFTMKVIVVTGKTFELIVGFLKIVQKTFKTPENQGKTAHSTL